MSLNYPLRDSIVFVRWSRRRWNFDYRKRSNVQRVEPKRTERKKSFVFTFHRRTNFVLNDFGCATFLMIIHRCWRLAEDHRVIGFQRRFDLKRNRVERAVQMPRNAPSCSAVHLRWSPWWVQTNVSDHHVSICDSTLRLTSLCSTIFKRKQSIDRRCFRENFTSSSIRFNRSTYNHP